MTAEVQQELDKDLADAAYQSEVIGALMARDVAAFAALQDDPRDAPRRARLLELAKSLQAETGCSRPTAKQHIARAIRRRRGEAVEERQRGGARAGAGAPPGNDNRWRDKRNGEQ